MLKRAFDILFSIAGLAVLMPVLVGLSLMVVFDSKGPVFYKQVRVGRNNSDFKLFKFRTMHINADKLGLLTVGSRDPRVTKVGYWLRKYKLDELPQLINVLIGNMSLVGPRPEVRKYVAMYDMNQKKVLTVKPGITDWASIQFSNENEVLAKSLIPEQTYTEEIMPKKLQLNLEYIHRNNIYIDLKIILFTLKKIIIR
jgi:lipopolysaccharide/colanic/teichoic acid biosynthesis glycosyltransferase